jgi:hypothetical protein
VAGIDQENVVIIGGRSQNDPDRTAQSSHFGRASFTAHPIIRVEPTQNPWMAVMAALLNHSLQWDPKGGPAEPCNRTTSRR